NIFLNKQKYIVFFSTHFTRQRFKKKRLRFLLTRNRNQIININN
uniref:Ribosomal protein L32 n=1 Tax=Strongyloides stercoralis TaxID=6248 RepID=A0A0K0EJ60_STRER